MITWKRFFLVFAALAVAFGAGVIVLHQREPSYGGRRLSYWVVHLVHVDDASGAELTDPTAAAAISRMGRRAIPYLLSWMEYEAPAPKWAAIRFGRKHGALQDLAEDFANSEIKKHERAYASAMAMQYVGAERRSAVPALVRLLNAPNAKLRSRHAVLALGQLGADGTLPLMGALVNQDPEVRSASVSALSGMGSSAAPAVSALIERLGDADSAVRCEAASALGKLHLYPDDCVPALTRKLLDPTSDVRAEAAEALGRFGPDASVAGPALAVCLGDPDARLRKYAAFALGKIKIAGPSSIGALTKSLKDSNGAVRVEAAYALAILGEAHDQARIVAEIQIREWSPNDVRARAAEALGMMGRSALPSVRSLQDALAKEENDLVREALSNALLSIRGRSSLP